MKYSHWLLAIALLAAPLAPHAALAFSADQSTLNNANGTARLDDPDEKYENGGAFFGQVNGSGQNGMFSGGPTTSTLNAAPCDPQFCGKEMPPR